MLKILGTEQLWSLYENGNKTWKMEYKILSHIIRKEHIEILTGHIDDERDR